MIPLTLVRGQSNVARVLGKPETRELYEQFTYFTLPNTRNLRDHYPVFDSYEALCESFLSVLEHPYEQLSVAIDGQTKEHMLLLGGEHSVFIPLLAFKSEDRGYMAAHWLDLGCPHMQRYLYEVLPADMHVAFDDDLDLVITPQGRGDYTLKIDGTFESFLKEHKQVSRHWNKVPVGWEHHSSVDIKEHDQIDRDNVQYHLQAAFDLASCKVTFDPTNGLLKTESVDAKGNTHRTETLRRLMYSGELGALVEHCLPPDTFVVTSYFGAVCMGYSLIARDNDRKELFWSNTIRRREEELLPAELRGLPMGNLILLNLIQGFYKQECYQGWTFNMGIDLFKYKLNWKPQHAWSPGFAFEPRCKEACTTNSPNH